MPRLTFDLGEIAQRAAGADEPIARGEPRHSRLRQMAPDVVAQPPDLLRRRRIGLEELLAQPQRARTAGSPRRPARRRTKSGDLHAAAAEIEQQAVRYRRGPRTAPVNP